MNHDEIETIRGLWTNGNTEEARSASLNRETKSVIDADLHLAWAGLLGELGLFDEVLKELNLANRDAPDTPAILRRLAEANQDNGKTRPAVDCWRRLITLTPEDAEPYRALGQLFEGEGEIEAAAEVFREGLAQTGGPAFKAALKNLGPSVPEEPQESPKDEIHPSETDLVRFCHLFEGREGVYARQWVGSGGKSGYTPVREPFTPSVARNHILGRFTIGIYPLRLDNTVRFLAFDIDVASMDIARIRSDAKAWEGLMSRAHALARTIIQKGLDEGLPMYMEDSGFKGRHCWLFFQDPVPGVAARRFAQAFLDKIGPLPPGVHIEVFPKQAAIRGDGLGNLIKLPLGFHRVSGRRSLFIDPEGQPFPHQLHVLKNIRMVERNQFLESARAAVSSTPARLPALEPAESENGEHAAPKRSTARPAEAAEYDPERDAELQFLLLKCEVLRTIVENLSREGRIDHEETIVLAHTIGHLKHGPEAFNAFMKRAVSVDPAQFLQSRLKGNPISCPKIRKRLGRLTSTLACDCRFPETTGLYPTPVLHAQGMEEAGPVVGPAVDAMRFEQLLREYLKAKRQWAEINQLINGYEKRLAQVFDESGAERIQTSQGILSMEKGPEGRPRFVLSM
jgi:hypothetical protein